MASIIRIETQEQFFNTITWTKMRMFGSFYDLPRQGNDDETPEGLEVLVAMVDGQAAGYINADMHGCWNIEVLPEFRGRGIARELCAAADVSFFCEVCSDDGAALAEALGFDYDDCRD